MIQSLSPEIVELISSYLPQRDAVALSSTCRDLATIAYPKHVSVEFPPETTTQGGESTTIDDTPDDDLRRGKIYEKYVDFASWVRRHPGILSIDATIDATTWKTLKCHESVSDVPNVRLRPNSVESMLHSGGCGGGSKDDYFKDARLQHVVFTGCVMLFHSGPFRITAPIVDDRLGIRRLFMYGNETLTLPDVPSNLDMIMVRKCAVTEAAMRTMSRMVGDLSLLECTLIGTFSTTTTTMWALASVNVALTIDFLEHISSFADETTLELHVMSGTEWEDVAFGNRTYPGVRYLDVTGTHPNIFSIVVSLQYNGTFPNARFKLDGVYM